MIMIKLDHLRPTFIGLAMSFKILDSTASNVSTMISENLHRQGTDPSLTSDLQVNWSTEGSPVVRSRYYT